MKRLIILLFPLFLVSCLGTKKVSEHTNITKETQRIESSRDSTKVETVNKAIVDEFLLSLRTKDSATNKAIRDALRGFKQSKKSGGNSTNIYFDEEALALRLKNIIGETRDTNIETNKDQNKEKTTEQVITDVSKKVVKMIPIWLWIIIGIFALPYILKTLTTVLGYFSPVVAVVNNIRKKI